MPHLTNYFSLAALAAAYRSGELSPVEVVRASLDRIEEVNPSINAIYLVDEETAMSRAEESHRRWRAGEPLGPLDGITTTTKDSLATRGLPGYRGSAAEPAVVAAADHPAVARVREAGAVILGKSTMSDYGILAAGVSSRHGITRNPWNLTRTTGASSSGAAASVAAGIEPAAIGTDIVGSIRLPASYCGLAGLKPSFGRVPYYFPGDPAVVAGPLARNVTDLAIMMNVLTRPDASDFTALPYDGTDYLSELGGFEPASSRILVIGDLGLGDSLAEDTLKAVEAAARHLEGVGATVDRLDDRPFEKDASAPAEFYYKIRCLSELTGRADVDAARTPVIDAWTREADHSEAVELRRAMNAMQMLREKAAGLISGHDFLLLPTTPRTAFGAELPAPDPARLFEPWANTFLFNLTQQPAASIPCGLDSDGLPIGLQIVGRRYDDIGVLRLAGCLESMIAWQHKANL